MDWKFETYVEKIKFDVLREVARASYAGNFKDIESKLPEILIPGRKANYRCCVYMERAIMAERVKITRGGEWDDFNIIDVIPIACDQCPMGGYTVTESCRGCIGHACKQACPKGAITVDGLHRAHIDKEKCVNCGLCAKSCPFGAIYNFRRPCQKACPTGAITMDENLSAKIDYSKCITCGQCTQKCPFGAIASKTFITFIIDHIRNNILSTKKRPIYAMVAPSVAAQFPGVNLNQIIDGILKLGFTNVVEVALGADVVAKNEARELVEKKILTSSCCPAFVSYIEKFHPELKDRISSNPSPMAQMGKIVKEKFPDALTVFIGPCTAKKDERSKPNVRPYVDYVLTFTELRAMFTAREIEIEKLQGVSLDEASPFGRGFGRIGGLSDAVVQALKEIDIKDFKVSAVACSGMRECIRALESLSTGNTSYNFIEGMSCEGGCVCGPESLNHNVAVGRSFIQSHARQAKNKTIIDSIKNYGISTDKETGGASKEVPISQETVGSKSPTVANYFKKAAAAAKKTGASGIATKYPGATNAVFTRPYEIKHNRASRPTVAFEQLKANPNKKPVSESISSSARQFTPKIDMSLYPGAKNAVFSQPFEPKKLEKRVSNPDIKFEPVESELTTTSAKTTAAAAAKGSVAAEQLKAKPEVKPVTPVTPTPAKPEVKPVTPVTPTPAKPEVKPVTPVTPTPARTAASTITTTSTKTTPVTEKKPTENKVDVSTPEATKEKEKKQDQLLTTKIDQHEVTVASPSKVPESEENNNN